MMSAGEQHEAAARLRLLQWALTGLMCAGYLRDLSCVRSARLSRVFTISPATDGCDRDCVEFAEIDVRLLVASRCVSTV
jgi:hypothetical protein